MAPRAARSTNYPWARRVWSGVALVLPGVALLLPVVVAFAVTVVASQVLPALRRYAPVVPELQPSTTYFGWAGIAPVSDGSTPPPGACDRADVTVSAGGADAAIGHRSLASAPRTPAPRLPI